MLEAAFSSTLCLVGVSHKNMKLCFTPVNLGPLQPNELVFERQLLRHQSSMGVRRLKQRGTGFFYLASVCQVTLNCRPN